MVRHANIHTDIHYYIMKIDSGTGLQCYEYINYQIFRHGLNSVKGTYIIEYSGTGCTVYRVHTLIEYSGTGCTVYRVHTLLNIQARAVQCMYWVHTFLNIQTVVVRCTMYCIHNVLTILALAAKCPVYINYWIFTHWMYSA